MNSPYTMPKAELTRVLERAHLPHDVIQEVRRNCPTQSISAGTPLSSTVTASPGRASPT